MGDAEVLLEQFKKAVVEDNKRLLEEYEIKFKKMMEEMARECNHSIELTIKLHEATARIEILQKEATVNRDKMEELAMELEKMTKLYEKEKEKKGPTSQQDILENEQKIAPLKQNLLLAEHQLSTIMSTDSHETLLLEGIRRAPQNVEAYRATTLRLNAELAEITRELAENSLKIAENEESDLSELLSRNLELVEKLICLNPELIMAAEEERRVMERRKKNPKSKANPAAPQTPLTMAEEHGASGSLAGEPKASGSLDKEPKTSGSLSKEARVSGSLTKESKTSGSLSGEPRSSGTQLSEPAASDSLASGSETSGSLTKKPETSGSLAQEPRASGSLSEEPRSSGSLAQEPETSGCLAEALTASVTELPKPEPTKHFKTVEDYNKKVIEIKKGIARLHKEIAVLTDTMERQGFSNDDFYRLMEENKQSDEEKLQDLELELKIVKEMKEEDDRTAETFQLLAAQFARSQKELRNAQRAVIVYQEQTRKAEWSLRTSKTENLELKEKLKRTELNYSLAMKHVEKYSEKKELDIKDLVFDGKEDFEFDDNDPRFAQFDEICAAEVALKNHIKKCKEEDEENAKKEHSI